MKNTKTCVSELGEKTRPNFFPLHYKGFVFGPCERELFIKEQAKIFPKVFPRESGYKLSKKEAGRLMPCFNEYRKIHSEKFLIKFKGKVIGWFQGEMEDFETFYMRNTGIIPEHQNKGLYKKFLTVFEKYIFGLGYARISSQHSPTNAVILSLKLKAGYVIAGQEFHERWGILLKLVKFSTKKRKDFFLKKVN